MKNKNNRFSLSIIALAVITSVSTMSVCAEDIASDNAQKQDDENAAIEEVVVKVSRLKGTASAVIEERKNQAFVADILGAEQIARTGDSDAAAALQRVTGLTLVDGKFIYVRGLGERYSSTQLNGSSVPSPDPTRTVIPLDLFPSSIIESLSVQKSYSPSMPAHFGGGNVDVRLKSIPTSRIFNVTVKGGSTTENQSNGLSYNGGGNDWYGKDDGTRAAPSALVDLWNNYQAVDKLSQNDNRAIAAQINRNVDPTKTSITPDFGANFTLGDSLDQGKFKIGYLTAMSYDNEWKVSKQYEGQDFVLGQDKVWSLVRGFDKVDSTEHSVRWSGMFNMGIEYNQNHHIDLKTLILHDTQDQIKDKIGNTNNVLLSDGLRVRDSEIKYEERQLISRQISGTHNFPSLWNLGIDWKYSNAKSNRFAPGNVTTRFILADENSDGIFDLTNESALRRATTGSRFTFQNLDDKVDNYGVNASLPLTLGKADIELKVGADYIEKSRSAQARRIDFNTLAFNNLDTTGSSLNNILSNDVILTHPLNGNDQVIRDTSVPGDDYQSAQLVDAYYFEGDFFYNNKWRVSGGVRWENFRQVVAPIDPATGQFDIPAQPTVEDLAKLAFKENNFYPALALTYFLYENMQFRLSYGETTVRPDIREVAPATYLDPLTDFPIGGTPSLVSTQVKNYDARWEWYLETGENLSVGLFYKDMLKPIEAVQSPAQDGPPLIRIANAETGKVYGVEAEFLKDFNFMGDALWGVGKNIFLSGNVTLSDSEIVINTQNVVEQTGVSTTITNPTRRMTGHSKYVVNLNLGYDSADGNHTATLAYNIFGERIIIPGIDLKDDAYEKPFNSLDFVYTYYPSFSTTLKFKVQNILDEKKEIVFENTTLRSQQEGIEFAVSFKWDFE
jgi:TonB-dependent receptor